MCAGRAGCSPSCGCTLFHLLYYLTDRHDPNQSWKEPLASIIVLVLNQSCWLVYLETEDSAYTLHSLAGTPARMHPIIPKFIMQVWLSCNTAKKAHTVHAPGHIAMSTHALRECYCVAVTAYYPM